MKGKRANILNILKTNIVDLFWLKYSMEHHLNDDERGLALYNQSNNCHMLTLKQYLILKEWLIDEIH